MQFRELLTFDFSNIKQVLLLVWQCSKRLTIIRLFLLVFQSILPFIPMYLLKMLVDGMADLSQHDHHYFIGILIGFAAVKLLMIIIAQQLTYVGLLQSDVVNDYMSRIVTSKAINIDFECFDSDHYHDVFQRAIGQASSRPLATLNTFIAALQSLISLCAIVFLLLTFHWIIIVILMVIAIPVAIVRWHYTNKVVELREHQTQDDRKSNYLKRILTSAADAMEVRVFAFGEKMLEQYLRLRRDLREQKRKLHLKRTVSLSLAQAFESVAIIAALGFIVFRAYSGNISPGDLVLYYQVFQKGQSNIGNLLKSFVSIHENQLYLTHLFDFLHLTKKIKDPETPIPLPDKINVIEFKAVSFIYPLTEKFVLNDINLTIHLGKLTAIVGENGSGKSTLVKLICRLYEPTKGQILINGIDIKSFDSSAYRRKISVIFQHFSKYNASVSDNIHFANYNIPKSQDLIEQSANLADAHNFIETLPNQYRTQLGRSFRSGAELSGGQWQKIALARAFYKKADITILDEPSSHIDPLAEHDIFSNLKTIASDRITLLITHRIYNLKLADHVIVMQNGRLLEEGHHENLMNKKGIYASMFEAQQ